MRSAFWFATIVLLVPLLAFAQSAQPAKPVAAKSVPAKPVSKAPPRIPAPEEGHANLILATGLGDKNPDIRKEAVAALGLVGAREPYLTGIAGGLDDKDVYVRLAAVASLVDLRHKDAIPALEKALNDPAPEVSFAAAKALWSLGEPKGRAALLGVMSGDTKTASGPITAEKRDMLRMFHTPRTLMLFAFKQGIGFVPLPGVGEGVSSLTLLLSDNGVSGRATTVLLLASDKSPEVVAALREALNDKDAGVRAAAVHSIALRDNPDFMANLVPLLDDPKENVRLRAAAGYARLALLPPPLPVNRRKANRPAPAPGKSVK